MRLIKLSSSNPKFKTLDFNPGLNIVSGLQLSKEDKKTINGIGKSLSLRLIHCILGSSFKSKDEKKFKAYLKTYGSFQLDFSHKGTKYSIKKDFSDPSFYINDTKITQTNYPNELTKIFLGSSSIVSFRQVFNVFARRYGETYYSHVLTQQSRPVEDYNQKFVNLHLLGIDTNLVEKKFAVKEKMAKLGGAEKVIEDYKNGDVGQAKDLQDQILNLKDKKDKFVIAENYEELKNEAEDLTTELNNFRNEIYKTENLIRLKKKNLEGSVNQNVDIKKIESVYNEAKFFFDKKVTKRLEEAQQFHNSLIRSRKESLKKHIELLDAKLGELNIKRNKIAVERDKRLRSLGNKGAFNEYDALNKQIVSLEIEKNQLDKYNVMLNQFAVDKADFELENAEIKREGLTYLQTKKKEHDEIEEIFRSLVKRFYENKGGSFNIIETSDARYLFDIEPHIPKDSSQGVGEVKVFCYDVLLYLLNRDLLGVIAHDGCIFSEMDPRQKSMILKVALDLVDEGDFQYFINIGGNSLAEILDKDKKIGILTEQEKVTIEESQILKLYDKDPQSWLFGEEFN